MKYSWSWKHARPRPPEHRGYPGKAASRSVHTLEHPLGSGTAPDPGDRAVNKHTRCPHGTYYLLALLVNFLTE